MAWARIDLPILNLMLGRASRCKVSSTPRLASSESSADESQAGSDGSMSSSSETSTNASSSESPSSRISLGERVRVVLPLSVSLRLVASAEWRKSAPGLAAGMAAASPARRGRREMSVWVFMMIDLFFILDEMDEWGGVNE